MPKTSVQRWRSWTQIGFFTLFLLAPPLNILRIDLTQGHAVLLAAILNAVQISGQSGAEIGTETTSGTPVPAGAAEGQPIENVGIGWGT